MHPALVILESKDTIYNVQVDYLAVSQVVASIGFYGGLSKNKMFGSESQFFIEALDPQCKFNISISLDPFYSAMSVVLPAMNYSVTLLPYVTRTPLPAPKFS